MDMVDLVNDFADSDELDPTIVNAALEAEYKEKGRDSISMNIPYQVWICQRRQNELQNSFYELENQLAELKQKLASMRGR